MADVDAIIKSMEDELMAIYNRQVARGVSTGWSELKLKELKEYEEHQAKVIKKAMEKAKREAKKGVASSFATGVKDTDNYLSIMDSIRELDKLQSSDKWGSFFKINKGKLDALISAVDKDFDNAMYATFRKSKDMYRETMVKATTNLGSGILTLDQATDLATRDFLTEGINSIKYANGAEVNIKSYANMVLRTANKRATLVAQGAVQDSWGVHTVQVSQYGACSDTCLPWQGRVYVDDVYSSGTAKESAETGYPLLSVAIADGLFHPNCRHTKFPWFEGVSSTPKELDSEQVRIEASKREKEMYIRRTVDKYKRLRDGSYDATNKAKYNAKVVEWRQKLKQPIVGKPSTKPTITIPPVQERKSIPLPKSLIKHSEHLEKKRLDIISSTKSMMSDIEDNVKEIERKLKILVDESEPAMRIPNIQTLKDIEKSQFKNQIALADEGRQSSRGYYGPDRRKRVSKDMFGWQDDLKGIELENYGYLSPKNYLTDLEHGGPDQYGQIVVKFRRDNIFNRTTFTVGDSLGRDFVPSPLNKPAVTAIDKWDIPKFLSKDDVSFTNPYTVSYQYVEAQYHGDLTFEDVDKIVFQKYYKGSRFSKIEQAHYHMGEIRTELGEDFIKRMSDKDIGVYVVYNDDGAMWDLVTDKLVGMHGVLQP